MRVNILKGLIYYFISAKDDSGIQELEEKNV